ncbi:hypothetical protein PG994_011727 [Apiospora phragmitis]|uniref:Secreted protein n=1 Tax=Apiospora phragmitis TaxID=2905665 RepID=A0ABR1TTR8_9PEZI
MQVENKVVVVVAAVAVVVDGYLVPVVGGTAPEVGVAAVATVRAPAAAAANIGVGDRKAAAVRHRTVGVFAGAAGGAVGAGVVGGVDVNRNGAFAAAAGEAKNAVVVVVAEDSSAESCGGAATTSWSIQGCRNLHRLGAQLALAHS